MTDDPKVYDLFGSPLQPKTAKYEADLADMDRNSLAERAARVRWLEQLLPEGTGFQMSPETYFVFEEARASFVAGNFVACTVLATAFIEHWLIGGLKAKGLKVGSLHAAIEKARAGKLVDDQILDRVDVLRSIRNPFIHLKKIDHPKRVVHRAVSADRDFFAQLHDDARQALIAMHGVAVHAFRS